MTEPETTLERDPFAPVEASPRGRTLMAVLALICALLAAFKGAAALTGPAGMVLGMLAHVKGSRLGLPAAVAAGVGTVIGMSITLLFR